MYHYQCDFSEVPNQVISKTSISMLLLTAKVQIQAPNVACTAAPSNIALSEHPLTVVLAPAVDRPQEQCAAQVCSPKAAQDIRCDVAVSRMGGEELLLGGHRLADVLVSVNVLHANNPTKQSAHMRPLPALSGAGLMAVACLTDAATIQNAVTTNAHTAWLRLTTPT
jgi:hypothetical protein